MFVCLIYWPVPPMIGLRLENLGWKLSFGLLCGEWGITLKTQIPTWGLIILKYIYPAVLYEYPLHRPSPYPTTPKNDGYDP